MKLVKCELGKWVHFFNRIIGCSIEHLSDDRYLLEEQNSAIGHK